jgi:hypothetical protein
MLTVNSKLCVTPGAVQSDFIIHASASFLEASVGVPFRERLNNIRLCSMLSNFKSAWSWYITVSQSSLNGFASRSSGGCSTRPVVTHARVACVPECNCATPRDMIVCSRLLKLYQYFQTTEHREQPQKEKQSRRLLRCSDNRPRCQMLITFTPP